MDTALYFSTLRKAILLATCGLPALAAPALREHKPVRWHDTQLALKRPSIVVTGRVVQANGEPLPGVTVLVKGTNVGTQTDVDGRYSLPNVSEGSTLVISYVGFVRQEVAVPSNGTPLNVTLATDVAALNEVVVVGYGTQQRGSVTGAIASVSSADIVSQPVADATQAIQGKAAGVTVTSSGGAPGGAAGTAVRIRGLTSAGVNSPLYVVDGFPLPPALDGNGNGTNTELTGISPNDIESIDILKDASATAIYGLRAANGVVIITTKRGKAGRSNINFDAYRGLQDVAHRLTLLNAEQYAVINNENRLAGGLPIVVPRLRNPQNLRDSSTNWQDQIFRRAVIQNYSLSATGGSENARYAVSATYFQQDGTIVGSNSERFTLRANGDVQISKIFKIGNSISLTHQEDRQITSNNGEYGTIQQAIRMIPIVPVYRPDGYYYEPRGAQDNFVEENPLASALYSNRKFSRNQALTTFFAELEPIKGLRLRTNVGANLIFENYNGFQPAIPVLTVGGQTYSTRYSIAGGNAYNNYSTSYLIENTATYNHLFGSKHQLTLLAGQSAQVFNFQTLGAARTGYLSNDLQNIDNGPINPALGNNGFVDTPQHLASYFGRINYEYAGKYLLSAVARYDGSGAFAPGSQFGFFPGVSAGWRISEENFMKDVSVVSNLKLRAGYGKVGNPLNAGRFAYLYTINSGILYPFGQGGTLLTGAAPTRLSNNSLRWETNNQANVGLDLGFLGNRIEATVDVYNRNSPNLIAAVPVSYVSGTYESINTNAASAYNRGIDLSVTTRNFVGTGGALNWSTTLNFSHYTTKLESLGAGLPYNGQGSLSGTIVRYDQGQAFGSFYGYVADGLFQTADEVSAANANAAAKTKVPGTFAQQSGTAAGDIRFKDLNGDGVINASDRTFIGNPNPKFTYGVTNTVAFKGFDLSVFIQGVQGNDVYNLNRYLTESALYGNSNGSTRVLARWTGPGTSNDVPRAVANDPNNNLRVSSYYVENGSYMRVKNLTLGYTLPKNVLNSLRAQQLRVYVTAQNLATVTKYTGYDPEVSASGIDEGIYPQPRVVLVGVNVGF